MSTLLPGIFGTFLGYVQVTGMSAATALTVPAGTNFALVEAEAQNVRWRDDGVSPTASVGMIIYSASEPQGFTGGQIKVAKFIQTTGGAILNVSFYG